MAGTNRPRRIAILGGGAGALAAAFGLTERPDWQKDYEITIYQLGWRLGGKGASGRNAGAFQRIEEHGLHVWGGFYENAFRVMRACYREMGRAPGAPLADWDQAFKPQNTVTWMEQLDDRWARWDVRFPPRDSTPGDGAPITAPWGFVKLVLAWMAGHFAFTQSNVDRLSHDDAEGAATVPDWLRATVREATPDLARHLAGPTASDPDREASQAHRPGLLHAALAWAESLPEEISGHTAGQHHGLLWMLGEFREWLHRAVHEEMDRHDDLRRLWILMDLCHATVSGMIRDGVVSRGFEVIDDQDWAAWLARHGASEITLKSGIVRGAYDFIFAYRAGDAGQPSCAAGVMARCLLRLAFEYQGALFFKMQAGMGDAVFTPLHECLKARGVRFEFFRRVTRLGLSGDRRSIATITLERQATVKAGAYRPFVDVMGLACWPSAPLYEQLVEGDTLEARGVDLESAWTDWPGVGTEVLEAGKGFDQVVLGISVGGLPDICAELIEANPAWGRMLASLETVQTQALQLWFNVDRERLGWTFPTILTAYAHPLETWADMSQVLPREVWPQGRTPLNLAYFCGPLADQGPPPPRSDHGFPARAHDRVRQEAAGWVERHAVGIWPGAATREGGFDWSLVLDPADRRGGDRLQSQYWRANVNPSDRYVLSLPGSTAHRLPPGGSGFDNLFLAGDWVRNGLDFGCVESAVMGGLLAARAIGGTPRLIPGEAAPPQGDTT